MTELIKEQVAKRNGIFKRLDEKIISILCCPVCKSRVRVEENYFSCDTCGTRYLRVQLRQGESTADFRIHRPVYCMPVEYQKWQNIQNNYENESKYFEAVDDLRIYLDEIDSVREIYTEEFDVKGSVLDVGGHQGRLRHFLKDEDVPRYVSIDPFVEIIQNMESRPNLLKAYPCLAEPFNFVAGYAENLPFNDNTFDYVHMRSVLDHFYDPYMAMKEAYRVLQPEGALLIGLTVHGGRNHRPTSSISVIIRKICQNGLLGVGKKVLVKLRNLRKKRDDHMFHWMYDDVVDLLHSSGFEVVKEHWQKPPFAMCVYILSRKRPA